jgi:hypothetical protein
MSLADVVERVDAQLGVAVGPVLSGLPGAPTVRDRAEQTTLPVLSALTSVFPGGVLRRGSTVAVTGSTALALTLLAAPSEAGAWCAVVGVPTLGCRAATELGVRLDRLALIPSPGTRWAAAVAALFDGVDLVVVRPPGRISSGESRRLMARARERGTTLVPIGPWDGADLRLSVSDPQWTGISPGGVGRLRARRLRVHANGRGAAARPRHTTLWLPARQGGVTAAADVPVQFPQLHSAAG